MKTSYRNKKILQLAKPKGGNYKKLAWTSFSRWIRSIGVCQFHSTCELLSIPAPCKCGGVLQACHKISRSKKAILFDERNVFCGCSASNTWAHWNQLEWDKLWRRLWTGDEQYLESQKNKLVKLNNWAYKIIHDDYSNRLKERNQECPK